MTDGPKKEMFKELASIGDAPLATSHGIAALALNMAIQYHDMAVVKDGVMYQQYKMEGRNMREIDLDVVFETAIKMEVFLLGSSDRIAKLVMDAVVECVDEVEAVPQELAAAPDKQPICKRCRDEKFITFETSFHGERSQFSREPCPDCNK